MHEEVITNTSCLIVLTNIDELRLLNELYGNITTTPDVIEELGEKHIPGWLQIKSPSDRTQQNILELQIDKGEASAITLALEFPGCLIILDDYKARKTAERLKLNVTGTIGVLIKAKRNGIIHSIRPILDKISQTNFRLSKDLIQEALYLAGELK